MGDIDATATAGVEQRGYRRGTLSTDGWDQNVVPVLDRVASFAGRSNTFLTPGRAAQGQKILALHNATGSPVIVNVNRIRVDALTFAPKLITALPPIIRVHRFTAIPTAGTALTKTALDSGALSDAAVTVWGDASADNTGSGTTLAVTVPTGSILGQAYGPRFVSAAITDAGVGYEQVDTVVYFEGETDVTLRALEGIVVFLDMASTVAGSIGNLTTDRWAATIDWDEYARP